MSTLRQAMAALAPAPGDVQKPAERTAGELAPEPHLWDAVSQRDSSQDGAFVFAVTSTKIYCRPGCPARRPAIANVRYFADGSAAARAGFRPCKRCKPDAPLLSGARVTRLARQLAADPTAPLEELAQAAGTSADQIRRQFREETGLAPGQFARGVRLEKLRRELAGGQKVLPAMYDAGFGSPRALSEASALLGMTPATYGKGGLGAEIGFLCAPTALGTLLVAGTQRGICLVALGVSAAELKTKLRAEFPRATIHADAGHLAAHLELVLRLLNGQLPSAALPVDIRATAFQWRVWLELARIPRGSTVTYAQLAARLDRPTAVRAVARANATNPLALVFPCHRVIGADGEMRGYRWGTERKSHLLRQEAAEAAPDAEPQAHARTDPGNDRE